MRTIDDIYTSILIEKLNQPTLDKLDSTSKTAVWRIWAYVTAVSIYIHEQIVNKFKEEIQEIADNSPQGTVRWYRNQVLNFQYNHNLVWSDYKYQYATIDEVAKIVSQCAVVERSDGTLLIKTAKGEVGSLEALDANELTALSTYANQIKFAGTKVLVTSFDADKLKVYYDVYYNALYDLTELKERVEAAITDYIQLLPFNSRLSITTLTDRIQAVEGVTDVVFQTASATYGNVPYAAINRVYQSNAGYMVIDSDLLLSDTISYIND